MTLYNYTTVFVVNLQSADPFFSKFEVECHSDTTGNNLIQVSTVDGVYDESLGRWKQKDVLCFRNLTVGQTYYFRVRVWCRGMCEPSAWSSWSSEVAGDATPPSVVYASEFVENLDRGCIVNLNPSTGDNDIALYEAVLVPSASGAPQDTDPWIVRAKVPNTSVTLNGRVADTLHTLWVRAIDTSGNAQAWTNAGSITPTFIVRDGYVNMGYTEDSASRQARTSAHTSYRPTTNPIYASDAGSSCTITIRPFTLQAGSFSIAVNGGAIGALQYNSIYYVYYDDPNMQGSSFGGGVGVVFHVTSSKESALANDSRIFVGSVLTPIKGGGGTIGFDDGGTGAQSGKTIRLYASAATVTTTSQWQNLAWALDPDDQTYTTGATNGKLEVIEISSFPSFYSWFSKLSLRARYAITGLSPSGIAYVKMSLDNGTTWTVLETVNSVTPVLEKLYSLPPSQNSSKVRFRIELPTGGGATDQKNASQMYVPTDTTHLDWKTVGSNTVITTTPVAVGTGASCSAIYNSGIYDSKYLYLNNLGFTVPSNATIQGVEVFINRFAPRLYGETIEWDYEVPEGEPPRQIVTITSAYTSDSDVRLLKAGSIVGTNHAAPNAWSGDTENVTYGSSTDLWGTVLTYSDVNSSSFGVALKASITEDNEYGYAVYNSVAIKLYYTISGGSSESSAKVYTVCQEVSM